MRTLKHLPWNDWPEADCEAFRAAYELGDLFDGTVGPGAHLSEGTRQPRSRFGRPDKRNQSIAQFPHGCACELTMGLENNDVIGHLFN
jgi:hypothetical protein